MQSELETGVIFGALKELEGRQEKAKEIASRVGEIIGYASPYTESQAGAKSSEVKVLVEVDKYVSQKRLLAQPGAILAAVDIATLDVISLKVTEVHRADFYSILGLREEFAPYSMVGDTKGLLTRPRLFAEPLLAFRFDENGGRLLEGRAANYVIEPRSPVVLPKPEYLEALLGIRGEVVLGALTIGEEPVISEQGRAARVLIPFDDLFYHTFIVGTTGSGKTTFVKNLIKSLLNLNRGVALVCIDENGDYVQTIFDPRWELEDPIAEKERMLASQLYGSIGGLPEINILVPVSEHFVKEASITTLGDLAEKYYEYYLKKLHMQAEGSSKVNYKILIDKVGYPVIALEVTSSGGKKENRGIRIIPYALNFETSKYKIAVMYPYFSARAREAFSNLINIFTDTDQFNEFKNSIIKKYMRLRSEKEEESALKSTDIPTLKRVTKLKDLVENLREIERDYHLKELCARHAKMFRQTLENIIYGLNNLNRMGIFDVEIGGVVVNEPEVEEFVKENSITVLDLRPLSAIEEPLARGARRILTLRLLDRLLGWKMMKEFEKTPPTIVLVDEAHRFFPRTAEAEEKDYVEYVSGALERVARLGRVRGLGLILSTHSPKDVHGVVLNLCNNKVIFRLEPSLTEELGLPRELRDFVSKASDRVGVVTSHALRLHYATFKTPPPVLGHFKMRG